MDTDLARILLGFAALAAVFVLAELSFRRYAPAFSYKILRLSIYVLGLIAVSSLRVF